MLAGASDFDLLQNALTSTGTDSAPPFNGYHGTFQSGHDVGPTPPCSAKAKTDNRYTSTPPV